MLSLGLDWRTDVGSYLGSMSVSELKRSKTLEWFLILAWVLFILFMRRVMSVTEYAPHPPQSPMRGCALRETHLPRQHQGYIFCILMLVFDLFCPWVFVPKITTCPGTGRAMSLTIA